MPWPRALGTPPWAVARRDLGHVGHDLRLGVRCNPFGRRGALRKIARRRPQARTAVPLYVGNRWSPRHVVLVARAADDSRVYDPAAGRRGAGQSRTTSSSAELDLAGWDRPWFVGAARADWLVRVLRRERGVPRLDHVVDDRQPLVEGQERRLHRVDGEPPQVASVRSRTRRPASCISRVIEVPLISRLSVLTVTRKRSRVEQPDRVLGDRGGRAGLHVRVRAHLERDPLVADVRRQAAELGLAVVVRRVMSSMIRTPWPSRSAPHHWIACQIDGSPNASPAWMVKWAFSRWRYSKASRCRVGG